MVIAIFHFKAFIIFKHFRFTTHRSKNKFVMKSTNIKIRFFSTNRKNWFSQLHFKNSGPSSLFGLSVNSRYGQDGQLTGRGSWQGGQLTGVCSLWQTFSVRRSRCKNPFLSFLLEVMLNVDGEVYGVSRYKSPAWDTVRRASQSTLPSIWSTAQRSERKLIWPIN